jgi:hypothetical protein
MMEKNREPFWKDAENAKVWRKEQSRDDTMPLRKDVGIKNSLPMQLLPTRGLTGLSVNRLSGNKMQSSS